MCRWIAYSGKPIFIEDVVATPDHSLVEQSQSATKAKTQVNGDGFGLAWYGEKPQPALYRDTLPAWADSNLISIAEHVKSKMFFAHVRASTSGSLSRDNCHPFVSDHWAFMHNGQIGDFPLLRRALENTLSDRSYAERRGSTDSELIFRLAIDNGLEIDPIGALETAIRIVQRTAVKVGMTPLVRFTSAMTNGDRLIAVRYATDRFAPSMFWTKLDGGDGYCIASEPFRDGNQEWNTIASSRFLEIENGNITIGEFMANTAMDAVA
ncbi:MAG: class II glutamine amidotransferase [Pseudomonadota bacterium]